MEISIIFYYSHFCDVRITALKIGPKLIRISGNWANFDIDLKNYICLTIASITTLLKIANAMWSTTVECVLQICRMDKRAKNDW